MNKYYALLTNLGAAKLANAAALGTKLQITQMAVGDGGGTLPTPNASQTALTGEKRRASLNSLSIDAVNSSQIIAEQVIPEGEGGFWIREIGLFDADGVMIAVANCPETYKPQLQEGSGRTQTVRMILIVNSTDAVTLKIDPSVVLATRKYVDDGLIVVKAYSDSLMAQHIAAADPHPQYAPKDSPALTGKPTAPTAAQTVNNTQVATTAFVKAAVADKMDISAGVVAKMKYGCPLVGSLIYWPLELMPQEIWPDMDMEFIPYINQTFDGAKYPLLAKLHPSLRLPVDMRAEFVRGWDNGRGGDIGRALMSSQGDASRQIVGSVDGRTSGTSGRVFGAAATGAFKTNGTGGDFMAPAASAALPTDRLSNLTFDSSLVVPTAAENRPRNVAWNMIVRAK